MANRVHNFNAGPAALPLPALERAQAELLDFAGTGMSVMEHSHRGKDYEAVHDEAQRLLAKLLGVPDTHQILLLQGGASQVFATLPMNFLPPGKSADYLVTGTWGEKALDEARTVGKAREAASTRRDGTYTRVPGDAELDLDPGAAYVHYTTNETIHGVQYRAMPTFKPGVPVFADMSSDILSGPLDVARFDLIYAGAQKNIGPSGLVLLVARKALLDRGRTDIPKFFRYTTHAANNSLYNTAPTFAIYLMRNILAWLDDLGGLAAIDRENDRKAAAVYGAIDAHPELFRCPVEPSSRSRMNVVFRLPSAELEERFLGEAKKARMVGLKGHRSVGGIRVSLYNAVSLASAEALAGLMHDFARRA